MNETIQYVLILVVNIARYFFFAGVPFLIFYVLFFKGFSENKIQARWVKRKVLIREIVHSIKTTLILAGVGYIVLKTLLINYSQYYENLSDYPLWWLPVSVFLAMVVYDTYFYWLHRTFHRPKLFKTIHVVHHKSVNPTPFTSYSFHFIEVVIEAMIYPIVLVLIPMHTIAIVFFTFLAFAINVYGHLGFEIAPKWFRHSILFEILNTSIHHNVHHSKFTGNYGLYFRVWDRVMGTEHPDYVKEYDVIQQRRFGKTIPKNFLWKRAFAQFISPLVRFESSSVKTLNNKEKIWKDKNGTRVIQNQEQHKLYFDPLSSADITNKKPVNSAAIGNNSVEKISVE